MSNILNAKNKNVLRSVYNCQGRVILFSESPGVKPQTYPSAEVIVIGQFIGVYRLNP